MDSDRCPIPIRARYFFYLFALILLSLEGSCQDYPSLRHLDTEIGLNHEVTCSYCDRYGYLWFGTHMNGLFRYDGSEMKKYSVDVDRRSSIFGNDINRIYFEDSRGDLWFASSTALTRYNRNTDDFTAFPYNLKKGNPIPNGQISGITEDRFGKIWIGCWTNDQSKGGVFRYDPALDSFITYMHDPDNPESLSGNCVSMMYTDAHGQVWVGQCGSGIDRIVQNDSAEEVHFLSYRTRTTNSKDPIRTTVTGMLEDHNKQLWIATGNGGILKLDRKLNRFHRYLLDTVQPSPDNRVHSLLLDDRGKLWLGTENGLAYYDPSLDTLIKCISDASGNEAIGRLSIRTMLADKAGRVWMLPYPSDTLYCYLPQADYLVSYPHASLMPETISFGFRRILMRDASGVVWISAREGGLLCYDPYQHSTWVYDLLGSAEGRLGTNELVSALAEDPMGKLWIGTRDGTLYSLEQAERAEAHYSWNEIQPVTNLERPISFIRIKTDASLWIGTLAGLYHFNPGSNHLTRISDSASPGNFDWKDYLLCGEQSSDGVLMLGALRGGFYAYDSKVNAFIRPELAEGSPSGFPPHVLAISEIGHKICLGTYGTMTILTRPVNGDWDSCHVKPLLTMSSAGKNFGNINAFAPQGDSGTWIASGAGGLLYLDLSDHTLQRYGTMHGLADEIIRDVFFDEQGLLWLLSSEAVSVFNPSTHRAESYGMEDGIPVDILSNGKGFVRRDGKILIYGARKLMLIEPRLEKHDTWPQLVLRKMEIHKQAVAEGSELLSGNSLNNTASVELDHDQNFLAFEFAAMDFSHPKNNRYKYFLRGVDRDTVHAGSTAEASYTDLRPGNYRFWFSAANSSGIWNPVGKSIDIQIRRPWWASLPAFLIYGMLFLGMVYSLIQLRFHRLKMARKQLEGLVKDRTAELEERDAQILRMYRMKNRFFANISHEFRTPLTLILNVLERVDSGKEDPGSKNFTGSIRRHVKKLLTLVNELLDLAKLEGRSMKIELCEGNVLKDIRIIAASFLSLAESRKIKLVLKIPDTGSTHLYDRKSIEKILMNLVSNALKFTPPSGEVHIGARLEPNPGHELHLWVADSGPGIDAEAAQRVFERFYFRDRENGSGQQGSGIGLALVRELVELLHGKIRIENGKLGGAQFQLSIPLGKDHLKKEEFVIADACPDIKGREIAEEKSVEIRQAPDAGKAGPRKSILLVEDHMELRAHMADQFNAEYRVHLAASGAEGLACARKISPDLIISDIMMPGEMDGIQLCEILKKDKRTSHIPLILLTARADAHSKIQGLRTGADDYLIKPFDAHELQVRVRNQLNRMEALRKRFTESSVLSPGGIQVHSHEIQFIEKIVRYTEEHISDPEFDVRDLRDVAGMSYTQVYRKTLALTGMTPGKLIREIRLEKAASLLCSRHESITRIALECGFQNPSHFASCFRKKYGLTPRRFMAEHAHAEGAE